jgi:NitT/TauT family transport system substrate-binding protein
VRRHPVATKRAVRAILKSADVCATDPEGVARTVVAKGLARNKEYTVQAIRELPYGRWRELDPVDTVLFYSLRLREVGMIKSSPQKIMTQGADWRFWKELRKELKA